MDPTCVERGVRRGTGIGAVVVGALAATGMGVPMALGVCAGLIAVSLPLAVRSVVL